MDPIYTLILGKQSGFIKIEGPENVQSHIAFNERLLDWQKDVERPFLEIYDLSLWETTVPEVVEHIYKEQLQAIQKGRKHCIVIEGCQDWHSRIFHIYVNDKEARETYSFSKTYNQALKIGAELGYDLTDIENKVHTFYSMTLPQERGENCEIVK